jgi:cell wall-associated NlpC family hydrolase
MRKIDDIETYVGVPFVKRGRSKEEGFDCFGLILDLTRRVYDYELPDKEYNIKTEKDIAKFYTTLDILEWMDETEIENIQYGDLIVIRSLVMIAPYHVGMYIGDDKVIHIIGRKVEIHTIEQLAPYIAAVFSPKSTGKSLP